MSKYAVVIVFTTIVSQLTTVLFSCSAQTGNFSNKFANTIRDENIKTVLLFREGTALSIPVIHLNSSEKLELHFDDLSPQQRSFSYTLVHCDSKWQPTPLQQQDYLDGYGSGRIEKVSTSFNTTCSYFNHSLIFPTDDAKPGISGNYALVVYAHDDPADIVLTRQFYVAEELVEVEATIKQPSDDNYYTGQEIAFAINYKGYQVADAASYISTVIRQNGNPFSDKTITKPRFIGPDQLLYGGNGAIVFDGGNEFRYFDIKSMKYAAEHIDRIDFLNPYYHVYLKPDMPRTYDPYFTQQELNGSYYVDMENAQDRHIDADYVFVHFTMPAQVPYSDGDVYIFGALSDWALTENTRMIYNPGQHAYEKAILLKQGFYNYACTYCPKGLNKPDLAYLEGNHYETTNAYTFFVYHADPSFGYDRLIAVKQLLSDSQ
jgi:hypothetical protein